MANLLSTHHSSASCSVHFEDEAQNEVVCNSFTGGWRACGFVLWFEFIYALTLFGIMTNIITYLTNELREGTAESASNANIWTGLGTTLSIFGAFVADAYLGRYRTIAFSSIVQILGLIFLTLSVTTKPFKPTKCDIKSSTCPDVTTFQVASFFIPLLLFSIGSGGLKPCLEALGADQFDDTNPLDRKRKSSFFNWCYFSYSSGSFLAFTVVVYIQDKVGWGICFGILTIAYGIAIIIFIAGTPFYIKSAPFGSLFTSVVQVVVAAIYNWNVKVPDDSTLLFENYDKESLLGRKRKLMHTDDLRFLDKASTMASRQSQLIMGDDLNAFLMINDTKDREMGSFYPKVSPWKLCTVTQVEEVKLIARIIPIWISSIMYGTLISQATSLFIKQGSSMEQHILSNFILPAASLNSFIGIIAIILLPFYDLVFVPTSRWLMGNERGITPLQRIGVGLFMSIIEMVISALIEIKRLRTIEHYGLLDNPNATIPMSICWLIPQYLIIGVLSVFIAVGLQEFLYEEMPDSMRSVGIAIYLSTYGVGGFLSSFLITIVNTISGKFGDQSWFVNNINRCHLDYFYWLLALITTINFLIYIKLACSFTYKRMR